MDTAKIDLQALIKDVSKELGWHNHEEEEVLRHIALELASRGMAVNLVSCQAWGTNGTSHTNPEPISREKAYIEYGGRLYCRLYVQDLDEAVQEVEGEVYAGYSEIGRDPNEIEFCWDKRALGTGKAKEDWMQAVRRHLARQEFDLISQDSDASAEPASRRAMRI